MDVRMNKRIIKHKKIILDEIKKGYKACEVGRILDIDTRTIKRALEIWKEEN